MQKLFFTSKGSNVQLNPFKGFLLILKAIVQDCIFLDQFRKNKESQDTHSVVDCDNDAVRRESKLCRRIFIRGSHYLKYLFLSLKSLKDSEGEVTEKPAAMNPYPHGNVGASPCSRKKNV